MQNPREAVTYRPIGVIHSPHATPDQAPIQPVFAEGVRGRVEILDEYAEGLADLAGFSHVYLIYHFDRAPAPQLKVKPFLQDQPRGLFATRAPCRPNAIGFSLVRLIGIEGNVLTIKDVDVLDGTPLLDIKPYVERFDRRENVRNGWQEDVDDATAQRRGRRQ